MKNIKIAKLIKFITILTIVLSLGMQKHAYSSELPKIHGFLEEAFAPRIGKDDTRHRQYNMAEGRVQLKSNYYFSGDNILSKWQTALHAKCDFVVDLYQGGKFLTELRELNASITPMDIVDIKAGRQVLTWGTGTTFF